MSLGLITDRAVVDVNDLKALRKKIMERTATPAEWTLWLTDLKGGYNDSDLNRVNDAMDTVATYLNTAPTTLAAYLAALGVAPDSLFEMGYATPVTVNTTNTWAQSDDVQATDMATYLNNLATLRAVLALPPDTPAVPASMALISYTDANDIEEILEVVYATAQDKLAALEQLADNTAASWVFCGQPPCGLVNIQLS